MPCWTTAQSPSLCEHERVQVDLEAVGHGVVVDARGRGGWFARARRRRDSTRSAMMSQFVRRLARLSAASAADVDAELVRPWIQPALQRTHHRRRDPGRMPVHAHHRAERLEPERIAQAREQLGAAVVVEHALDDGRAQRRHAGRQPLRHAAAVQRKIGDARALHVAILRRRGQAVIDGPARDPRHSVGTLGPSHHRTSRPSDSPTPSAPLATFAPSHRDPL